MLAGAAQSDISHKGTVSMIRNHVTDPADSPPQSWSWFQLSGLRSSGTCKGSDNGVGDLAYISLPDTEEFMLTLLLSAYLGGHPVEATIDDNNQYQNYCRVVDLALAPAANPTDETPAEILAADHANLISLYTMDNTGSNALFDDGRYSLHGDTFGISTSGGVIGKAMYFNGATDRVNFGPAHSDIFTGRNAKFSISLWVKLNNNHELMRLLTKSSLNTKGGVASRQLMLQTDGRNNLLFGWNSSRDGKSRRTFKGPNIPANTWQHLVVTYDGSLSSANGKDRVIFYLNGVKAPHSAYSSAGELSDILDDNGNLTLGGESGVATSGAAGLNGGLDQVRMFNRRLTATEALELYQER